MAPSTDNRFTRFLRDEASGVSPMGIALVLGAAVLGLLLVP
jgi:hypothetical protein